MASMIHPSVKPAFKKFVGHANWARPRHEISSGGCFFPHGTGQLTSLLTILGHADPSITGDDTAAQMVSAINQQNTIAKRGWRVMHMVGAIAGRFPSGKIPEADLADILTEARTRTDTCTASTRRPHSTPARLVDDDAHGRLDGIDESPATGCTPRRLPASPGVMHRRRTPPHDQGSGGGYGAGTVCR